MCGQAPRPERQDRLQNTVISERYGGLRLGEAIALQWGDIDWHRGFIEMRRAFVRGRLTTTKNTKPRRVDMSAQLQELKRHRVRTSAGAVFSRRHCM